MTTHLLCIDRYLTGNFLGLFRESQVSGFRQLHCDALSVQSCVRGIIGKSTIPPHTISARCTLTACVAVQRINKVSAWTVDYVRILGRCFTTADAFPPEPRVQ
jgi:hypothetical protein